MHKSSRRKIQSKDGNNWGKSVVLGLLDRESREVRAAVAPNRKKHHIEPHLESNLAKTVRLYTDEHPAYLYSAERLGLAHEIVNHLQGYVKGRVHTNGLENFWSLLKRSLKGTYVSVDPAHLFRYLDEQCFRYNRRHFNDAERFALVMGQVIGRRITYNELIGKTETAENQA